MSARISSPSRTWIPVPSPARFCLEFQRDELPRRGLQGVALRRERRVLEAPLRVGAGLVRDARSLSHHRHEQHLRRADRLARRRIGHHPGDAAGSGRVEARGRRRHRGIRDRQRRRERDVDARRVAAGDDEHRLGVLEGGCRRIVRLVDLGIFLFAEQRQRDHERAIGRDFDKVVGRRQAVASGSGRDRRSRVCATLFGLAVVHPQRADDDVVDGLARGVGDDAVDRAAACQRQRRVRAPRRRRAARTPVSARAV